ERPGRCSRSRRRDRRAWEPQSSLRRCSFSGAESRLRLLGCDVAPTDRLPITPDESSCDRDLVLRSCQSTGLEDEVPVAVRTVDEPVLADAEVDARVAERTVAAVAGDGVRGDLDDLRRFDRHGLTFC